LSAGTNGNHPNGLFHAMIGVPDCDGMRVALFASQAAVNLDRKEFRNRGANVLNGGEDHWVRREEDLESIKLIMRSVDEPTAHERAFGIADLNSHEVEPLSYVVPHSSSPKLTGSVAPLLLGRCVNNSQRRAMRLGKQPTQLVKIVKSLVLSIQHLRHDNEGNPSILKQNIDFREVTNETRHCATHKTRTPPFDDKP
jgi:hypothetical protein